MVYIDTKHRLIFVKEQHIVALEAFSIVNIYFITAELCTLKRTDGFTLYRVFIQLCELVRNIVRVEESSNCSVLFPRLKKERLATDVCALSDFCPVCLNGMGRRRMGGLISLSFTTHFSPRHPRLSSQHLLGEKPAEKNIWEQGKSCVRQLSHAAQNAIKGKKYLARKVMEKFVSVSKCSA